MGLFKFALHGVVGSFLKRMRMNCCTYACSGSYSNDEKVQFKRCRLGVQPSIILILWTCSYLSARQRSRVSASVDQSAGAGAASADELIKVAQGSSSCPKSQQGTVQKLSEPNPDPPMLMPDGKTLLHIELNAGVQHCKFCCDFVVSPTPTGVARFVGRGV